MIFPLPFGQRSIDYCSTINMEYIFTIPKMILHPLNNGDVDSINDTLLITTLIQHLTKYIDVNHFSPSLNNPKSHPFHPGFLVYSRTYSRAIHFLDAKSHFHDGSYYLPAPY